MALADCGNPYDIARLPGFEFGIEHPEAAYRRALLKRFPEQHLAIAHWFDEMASARRAAFALMAERGLPPLLAWGLKLWRGAEMRRLMRRTLAEALAGVSDAGLRAVLGARWGDYGAAPASAPLLEHALVTGAYNGGAYFPVGGPGRFAHGLLPVVLAAGGAVELGASVEQITLEDGRAGAVVYRQQGQMHRARARQVISAMGVLNTARCLGAEVAPDWQAQVQSL